MGYVNSAPRNLCGLVVVMNQKSVHYCKKKAQHQGGCKA